MDSRSKFTKKKSILLHDFPFFFFFILLFCNLWCMQKYIFFTVFHSLSLYVVEFTRHTKVEHFSPNQTNTFHVMNKKKNGWTSFRCNQFSSTKKNALKFLFSAKCQNEIEVDMHPRHISIVSSYQHTRNVQWERETFFPQF